MCSNGYLVITREEINCLEVLLWLVSSWPIGVGTIWTLFLPQILWKLKIFKSLHGNYARDKDKLIPIYRSITFYMQSIYRWMRWIHMVSIVSLMSNILSIRNYKNRAKTMWKLLFHARFLFILSFTSKSRIYLVNMTKHRS